MDEQAKQWLAAYRRGDLDALGRLVEHWRRPLYAFIYHQLRGRGDAEDIFQETWIRAVRGLDAFRGDRALSWLFRIARNLVVDEFRRRCREDTAAPRDGAETSVPAGVETHADGRPGADAAAVERETAERVAAAVRSLPDEQREVFLLRTEGDISFREIARMQGVPLNTALGRMHYATRRLRELLRDEYDALRS